MAAPKSSKAMRDDEQMTRAAAAQEARSFQRCICNFLPPPNRKGRNPESVKLCLPKDHDLQPPTATTMCAGRTDDTSTTSDSCSQSGGSGRVGARKLLDIKALWRQYRSRRSRIRKNIISGPQPLAYHLAMEKMMLQTRPQQNEKALMALDNIGLRISFEQESEDAEQDTWSFERPIGIGCLKGFGKKFDAVVAEEGYSMAASSPASTRNISSSSPSVSRPETCLRSRFSIDSPSRGFEPLLKVRSHGEDWSPRKNKGRSLSL